MLNAVVTIFLAALARAAALSDLECFAVDAGVLLTGTLAAGENLTTSAGAVIQDAAFQHEWVDSSTFFNFYEGAVEVTSTATGVHECFVTPVPRPTRLQVAATGVSTDGRLEWDAVNSQLFSVGPSGVEAWTYASYAWSSASPAVSPPVTTGTPEFANVTGAANASDLVLLHDDGSLAVYSPSDGYASAQPPPTGLPTSGIAAIAFGDLDYPPDGTDDALFVADGSWTLSALRQSAVGVFEAFTGDDSDLSLVSVSASAFEIELCDLDLDGDLDLIVGAVNCEGSQYYEQTAARRFEPIPSAVWDPLESSWAPDTSSSCTAQPVCASGVLSESSLVVGTASVAQLLAFVGHPSPVDTPAITTSSVVTVSWDAPLYTYGAAVDYYTVWIQDYEAGTTSSTSLAIGSDSDLFAIASTSVFEITSTNAYGTSPPGLSSAYDVDSCGDLVRNGEESGVDCGGPYCPQCHAGYSCDDDDDCDSSLYCIDGVCMDESLQQLDEPCSFSSECASTVCLYDICVDCDNTTFCGGDCGATCL